MISRSTLARLVLAAAVAATLPGAGQAQPSGNNRVVPVPCCTCVDGSVKSVALSTGAIPWTVTGPGASGGNAVGVSHAAWSPLAGASWVAPSSGSSSSAQAGTYVYTVRFQVPRCVIGGRVTIKGKAGADNRVTVKLDGATIGSTPGNTNAGFQAANFASFSASVTSAGIHTLTVEVKNNEGPTGMATQAVVEMQCPKGAEVNNT